MCCEQLICASCAGTVADARCPVCRTARAELHGSQSIPLAVWLSAAVVLLSVALLLAGRLG